MNKEKIIQFYKNYKLYIFPIAVALSSLFLIVFAIYPQTAKLIKNQKVAGDLMSKSKFLATKVTALESLDPEDLSQKLGIALLAFPAEKDYASTLGLLQGLAAQSGFTISSVSVSGGGGATGNANSFEIKMEIRGPRSLFQSFLNSLENSPQIIRLSSFDISSVRSSEAMDASLTVEILYSAAPQVFGSVDSPLPSLNQQEEELLVSISKVNLTIVSSASASSQRGKANPFE